jgi:signal transduction histidine kinase
MSRELTPGASPEGNGRKRLDVLRAGGARAVLEGGAAPEWRGVAPVLSAEFVEELQGAQRRVAVLEEANRAIRDSMDRMARLSSFSEGLDRIVNLEDVADLLFGEMRGILPVTFLLLAVTDPADPPYRAVRVEPAEAAAEAAGEMAAQIRSGMFDWAMRLRRPTVIAAEALGRNVILLPLATARRAIGVLMAGTALETEAVEQQHLTLAAVLARQAAECIHNLWLSEDIRRQHDAGRRAAELAAARRLADLGLLVETAGTLSGRLEEAAALQVLVEATAVHLGVQRVAISLLEPEGGQRIAAGRGLPEAWLADVPRHTEPDCPLDQVARHRQAVSLADTRRDPQGRCELLQQAGAAAYLGVPLVARDQVIGVLSAMTDTPREFTAEETALLTGLAAQGAIAIDNAHLFADVQGRMEQQQRALARLVQSAHLASVGLLSGGVAHDINNPLCIISNHLQLLRLKRGQLPPEVETALTAIEASVRRIAGSIEALLDYSRVRPGERQPTDVSEAVRRILQLVQYHPLCRRMSIATDLTPDLPPVNLDRTAWEQVMLELITNAREAMSEGGRVWLGTRMIGQAPPGAAAGGDPWVEVLIEDDGPGIPAEDLPRIFDPFFTTKSNKRGMGIGLTICRDIVTAHGGILSVGAGEQGTRVTIQLPSTTRRAPERDPEDWLATPSASRHVETGACERKTEATGSAGC